MKMTDEELKVWDSYFAEISGWTYHPGYFRDNAKMPTLEDCANVADKMIIIRRQRQGIK